MEFVILHRHVEHLHGTHVLNYQNRTFSLLNKVFIVFKTIFMQ